MTKLPKDQLPGIYAALTFGMRNAPWEGESTTPWADLAPPERKAALKRAKKKTEDQVAYVTETFGSVHEMNKRYLARFDMAAIAQAAKSEHAELNYIRELVRTSRGVAGVRMAINDSLSQAGHFSVEQRRAVNHRLAAENLPLLHQLSAKLLRKQTNILKRGRIRNETEYYLVKEIVCDASEGVSPDDLATFGRMIEEFEFRAR